MDIFAEPDFQLHMTGYTTVAHTEVWAALETVLPRIVEYFQDQSLTMEWAVDGSGSKLLALESIADIHHLKAMDWRGRLLFAFVGDDFTGGCEIYRYEKSRLARLKRQGLKQHQFALETDLPRGRGRVQPYCGLAARIAEAFDATYLFCHQPKGFRHQFNTVSEVGVGLLDVYWLNVFGPEWCDLIGRERLLSAPAHEVRAIDENRILLRPCEGFPDPADGGFAEARDRIKRHIGAEHFAREAAPRTSNSIGSGGPLTFLRFLWRADREFRDESHAAQRPPTFDYSRMTE